MAAEAPLLHVGLHKTATTWLQAVLFGQERHRFELLRDRGTITEDFVRPDSLGFDDEAVRGRYAPDLTEARHEGAVPVLSHERLSGYPASGGYDREGIAERLATVFDEARVLLVVREQNDLLYSWFMQYVRDGGVMSVTRYLDPPQPDLIRVPQFRAEFYEFDRLVALYRRYFTPDRVLVLPFELLKRDPRRFTARITEFVGVPAVEDVSTERRNTGSSAAWIPLARLGNRLLWENQLNPGACLPFTRFHEHLWKPLIRRIAAAVPSGLDRAIENRMRSVIREEMQGRFSDSNRRLAEMVDWNPADFGYEIAPEETEGTSGREEATPGLRSSGSVTDSDP